MAISRLYIVTKPPVGRTERRAAQKEYDHINKTILPLFAAFYEVYPDKANEEQRRQADKVFRSECAKVNKNKKYVIANEHSFMLNTETKEEAVLEVKINNRNRYVSYGIIAFVLLIIILVLTT